MDIKSPKFFVKTSFGQKYVFDIFPKNGGSLKQARLISKIKLCRGFGANLWSLLVDGGHVGGAPGVLVSRLAAGKMGHHRHLHQHHVLQHHVQGDPHKICGPRPGRQGQARVGPF